jgi:Domain of unknown function (DUF4276)
MVKELRIYFEGDVGLRPGFRSFFDSIYKAARTSRCRVELVATDGTPVQDYNSGLKANPDAWNVLLLDSDVSVDRTHVELCRSKQIEPSRSDSGFWMVQVMESWFLADADALRAHFGKRFQEGPLKGNPKVEEIPKGDVGVRLKSIAGGEYDKVRDGVKLLTKIDPAKVRNAAPNCERMFSTILEGLK